jgi:hypothetical protein
LLPELEIITENGIGMGKIKWKRRENGGNARAGLRPLNWASVNKGSLKNCQK